MGHSVHSISNQENLSNPIAAAPLEGTGGSNTIFVAFCLSVVPASNHSEFAGRPFALFQSLKNNLTRDSLDGSFASLLRKRVSIALDNASIAESLAVYGEILTTNYQILLDSSHVASASGAAGSSGGGGQTDWLLIEEVALAGVGFLFIVFAFYWWIARRVQNEKFARAEKLDNLVTFRRVERRKRAKEAANTTETGEASQLGKMGMIRALSRDGFQSMFNFARPNINATIGTSYNDEGK